MKMNEMEKLGELLKSFSVCCSIKNKELGYSYVKNKVNLIVTVQSIFFIQIPQAKCKYSHVG